MSRATTLVLLVAVALLGAVVYWQLQREEGGGGIDLVVEEPLFPGVDPNRVREIRVENLERALFVVLARDDQGAWRMVEPIAFPASAAHANFLLQVAEHNTLVPLPGVRDLSAVGLDPPRGVLTYVEDTAGGERRHVVEVGAVDPDPSRMAARARERVWTTERNVEAVLDYSLDDLRDRRVLSLAPRNVVELHRTGSFEGRDVSLDALLDGGEWRMTRPLEARLDPVAVGHVVVTACLLEALDFVRDVTRPLSELGLDPPELELTLVTVADERQTLLLGRDANDRWHAMREGGGTAFLVEADNAAILAVKGPDLVDRAVVRATRDDVQALVLRRGGRDLRVERGNRETWTVSEGSQSFPADQGALRDLLGEIERLELGGRVDDPAVGVEDAFEGTPESGSEGFLLDLREGTDQGGTFGGEHTLSTGDRVRLFRRRGDTVVAWVDPRAADLLRWTLEDLRSLNLMDGVIEEHQVAELRVAGARERTFERDPRGRWRETGSALEAHELVPLLDALFFLRGARNVPREGRPALEDAVTVTMLDEQGDALAILLGRAPDEGGRVEVELMSRRAIPAVEELYTGLRALVD